MVLCLGTVCVLFQLCLLGVWARTTVELKQGDSNSEELQFRVITKREALHGTDNFPFVQGRTFRASEPLDPSLAAKSEPLDPSLAAKSSEKEQGITEQQEVQNIYEHFETVNQIFQPVVEGGEEEGVDGTDGHPERHEDYETDPEYFEDREIEEIVPPENLTGSQLPENSKTAAVSAASSTAAAASSSASATGAARVPSNNGEVGTKYSAQYPYSQTSNLGNVSPYESSERRVTLVGSGPRVDQQSGYESGRRVQTHGSFGNTGSYPQHMTGSGSQTGYPQGTGYQTTVYNTGSGSRSGYSDDRYTDGGRRGNYYDGPVYRDNNGHYIDANGRHLDSTGRYYDVSGRYRDAVVTRTVTYGGSGDGARYVDPVSDGRTVYNTGGSDDDGYTGSRPIDSFGESQFYYSSGNRYPATYDPIVSQISSDPNCPVTYTRVTINGMSCADAITQLGQFVCYNYERVSTDCCERCLQVKQAQHPGCEYGDRSNECERIEPGACYNQRNREICCQRCASFQTHLQQNALTQPGCEYGDFTRNCSGLVHTPYLCYMPQNHRVCCETCPRLARNQVSNCQWGDQNPEFCEPFEPSTRRLKINCYIQGVRNICCQTCEGLRSRIQQPIAGCEYGDSPTLFRTSRGTLDCVQYIHQYGVDTCNDSHTSSACCYTCYRYRQHLRQYQRQQG